MSARIQTLITRAFRHAMAEDDRLILLGQDIRMPAGGAFKATWGLSDVYPDRVVNTPISEAATMGLATGMSLGGKLPVVEVMFGDFLLLCADQILNHAAKFKWMYDIPSLPIVIRTPMGANDGYGPTHSQSVEKYLFGMPGLSILALNDVDDTYQVYRKVLRDADGPTLVLEHKRLYRTRLDTNFDPPPDPHVTVWAYGWMAAQARKAIKELPDVKVELVCPLWLQPMDFMDELWESLEKTRRLIIVEEGSGMGSPGSCVAGKLLGLDLVKRFIHLSNNTHIPAYNEGSVIPSVDDIKKAIQIVI